MSIFLKSWISQFMPVKIYIQILTVIHKDNNIDQFFSSTLFMTFTLLKHLYAYFSVNTYVFSTTATRHAQCKLTLVVPIFAGVDNFEVVDLDFWERTLDNWGSLTWPASSNTSLLMGVIPSENANGCSLNFFSVVSPTFGGFVISGIFRVFPRDWNARGSGFL